MPGAGIGKAAGAADVLITLTYGEQGLVVDPPVASVSKGQTIGFEAKGTPGGKARVTFRNAKYFSQPVYNEGDPPILVKRSLTGKTGFECDLVLNGKVQKRPPGQKGGELERGNPS